MPTAFGYVRVSTDGQKSSGVGDDYQVKVVTEMYERKLRPEGLALGEIVKDLAVSCTVPFGRRPGGARVNMLLRRGDAIVIPALDRAFGDMVDAMVQVQQWTDAGVRIVVPDFLNSEIDSGSPIGRLLLSVIAFCAEWRIRAITERNQHRVDSLRKQGRPHCSAARGFMVVAAGDRKHYVPDPEEREVMRWIARQRDAGHDFNRIAATLRRLRVRVRPSKPGGAGRQFDFRRCSEYYHAEKKLQALEAAAGCGPDEFVYADGRVLPLLRRKGVDRQAAARYNLTSQDATVTVTAVTQATRVGGDGLTPTMAETPTALATDGRPGFTDPVPGEVHGQVPDPPGPGGGTEGLVHLSPADG